VFNQPDASATFTIWARVIAATDGNDSFWVKMDNGSPIKWNGIPLGSAWHWVQVKADGASAASQFSLGTGLHTLKIAYREDGAKLDELIITSNSSFNPSTMTVPTAAPTIDDHAEDSSSAGAMISWQDVPGATSYVLTDDNGHVVAASTGHVLVSSTDTSCVRVAGVGPGGTGPASGSLCFQQLSNFVQRKFPDSHMSVVSPMLINGSGALAVQSGTAESLDTVPAHGRGRYDFQIVGPATITVWAEIVAPDHDHDSFWVRMDQGPWVKWNNIPTANCTVVKNSDSGSAVVLYNLTTGSHFVEFAYREIGTLMFRLSPVEGNPEIGSCDD
jgi:hypothetical protein